jgi:hypothetical protein
MPRVWCAAAIGFLLLAGCGPTQSEDFESFCRVVNEINKDANLSNDDKLAKIATRSEEYTKSPESKAPDNVWKKLGEASIDQKYAVVHEGAKAAGKTDWKCKGYETLLVQITVQQTMKKKEAEEAAAKTATETKPDGAVTADAQTASAQDKKATKDSKKKATKKKTIKKKKHH